MKKSETNAIENNDLIRCTRVKFDGISHTNPEFLNKFKEIILKEKSLDKLIQNVNDVQQKLSSLDCFSSVTPIVATKNDNSEVEVTFKLKENKMRCSLGSTINKQGKVGFEASLFVPNLFGTLSSGRLSLETFGRKSKEFCFSLFTPMLLASSLNMTYHLFNNTYSNNNNHTSPMSSYFGSKLKLSDKLGINSLCIESNMRDSLTGLNSTERTASCNIEQPGEASSKTLKNSITYSWNKNYATLDRNADTSCQSHTKSEMLRQFCVEFAGFNSDVQFIRIEAFQQWRSKLKRYIKKPVFLNSLHLNINFGLGLLLPNFSNGKFGLRTSSHDRFFLGGSSGFHRCLMGFASGSVGPSIKNGTDVNIATNNKHKNVYTGSNGYLSGEITFQYPLNTDKLGLNIEPHLISYVNAATVIDGNSTFPTNSRSSGYKQEVLNYFKRTIRASTGIGISLPVKFADLTLLFSAPLRYQETDIFEKMQFGMRINYAPI